MTNIEAVANLQSKLEADIEQRKAEALTTASQYIKTAEKRKAFLNRINYSLGITHEYMNKTANLINQLIENYTADPLPSPVLKTNDQDSIRKIYFNHGKEAARAVSLARAQTKYDY